MSRSSLFRGTAIVGGLNGVSRVLGFVRDLLMARLIGASATADIFFVAFRIPNTLRSFIAEGALTSAYIPVLADELEKKEEEGRAFYRLTISILLAVSLLLCLLAYIFSEEIINIFAPGFSSRPGALSQTAHLLIIMLPFIPSISMVTIINGLLAILHHYGAASFAQISVNICMIGGILIAGFAPVESQTEIIAWSVFVAAILQYLLLAYFAKRVNYSPLPLFVDRGVFLFTDAIKKMLFLMLPALLSATVYQITIIANTALASLLPQGRISWLFYSERVSQIPIGIFTIALSSVLLPRLAESHAKNDADGVSDKLLAALRYTAFILIPVSALMFTLSVPIVRVLFERGAFTYTDSISAGAALEIYALGLVPFSLMNLMSRHLIAKKKPLIPALIALASLFIAFVVALMTMGDVAPSDTSIFQNTIHSLQQEIPFQFSLGHVGLALSTVSASLTSLLLYLLILIFRDSIELSPLIGTFSRSLIGGVALGVTALSLLALEMSPLTVLLVAIPAGSLSYIVFTYLLKLEELREMGKVFKRISR